MGSRNQDVVDFLAASNAEWLFWVDIRLAFAPNTIDRLLAAADPVDRPIVAALSFVHREPAPDGDDDRRGSDIPAIFDRESDGNKARFKVRWDYRRNGIIRAAGAGTDCVLTHRSVFERIAGTFGTAWYSRAPDALGTPLIPEDLSFCARALTLDIPIHVHTGVSTVDANRVRLVEEEYWRQQALIQVKQPRSGPIRFAAIPTHDRPARLLALVAALGPQCDTIIILDNASKPPVRIDTLQHAVPDKVTIDVMRDEEQPPNLARLWNVMFDRARELAGDRAEWNIAVFNDDSIVPLGWYDAVATALREHPGAAAAATKNYGLLQGEALILTGPPDLTFGLCPFAFAVRGERGLRADERMHWYWMDLDFDWQARINGGVVSIPGFRVINSHEGSSTIGILAEQAARDLETFVRKWGINPLGNGGEP